jgi:hypothetical protein
METFLISVSKNDHGAYEALFSNGVSVELSGANYADALLEADTLDETEFA